MVSELSASLQGSLTFPTTNNTTDVNNATHANNTSAYPTYTNTNTNANTNYTSNTNNVNHTTYPVNQGTTTYYVPTHYGSGAQGSVGGGGSGDGRGSAGSNEGDVRGAKVEVSIVYCRFAVIISSLFLFCM